MGRLSGRPGSVLVRAVPIPVRPMMAARMALPALPGLDPPLQRLLETLDVFVHLLLDHALNERPDQGNLDDVVDGAFEHSARVAREEAPGAAVLIEVALDQGELTGAGRIVPVILLGPL